MHAFGIDPRDARVQEDLPTYRVDVWSAADGTDDIGSRCDTWRIEGARDVDDIFRWIDQEHRDRRVVLYLETPLEDGGVRLSRLRGEDPLDSAWLDRV